jgi:hypothetical protein
MRIFSGGCLLSSSREEMSRLADRGLYIASHHYLSHRIYLFSRRAELP